MILEFPVTPAARARFTTALGAGLLGMASIAPAQGALAQPVPGQSAPTETAPTETTSTEATPALTADSPAAETPADFTFELPTEPVEGMTVLDEINVTAAPGTTTEDSASWTTEWMRSATGLVLSQKETPQSTSVITEAQMKDRNITTVEETMNAATGITSSPLDSERVNFYSRGFAVDAFQYDGVPIPRDQTWQFGDNNADMILYDHVEIVRGATGLMQGAGEPGASINFIRKRPADFFRRETAAAIAYPLGARVEGDVSGPLNESGTVRGRLLGAIDSREGTLDGYKKDRYVGFGALEVDLTDSTLLNLGVSYQETRADTVTWSGLPPWYRDLTPIDWDWGSTVGADWTFVDTKRTEAFASLEHIFENGWTGRLVFTHARNHFDSALNWISPATDAAGNPTYPDRETGLGLEPYSGKFDGGYTQNSLNAVLNGDFEAFGRVHQFVAGAFGSVGEAEYDRYDYTSPMAPIGNIFDWSLDYPEPTFSETSTGTYTDDQKQLGIYGAARIHVTDALAVIGGARVNWWDRSSTDPYGGDSYAFKGIVTPYFGATYDIDEVFTAYGSVTSIYKPQVAQDIDQNYLDPTYGWNYELGVKAMLFDGGMYASLAGFQTQQKDVAEYAGEVINPDGTQRSYYEVVEGTTTRGFEIEAAGAISERWNASLGYTYRYSVDGDDNELFTDQPRNTLKAATDYRIPGILDDRLTLGGAVRWQSATDSIPWQGGLPNIEQDSYAVFDVNARYDVNDETALTLTVNNVMNEKYYASSGFYNSVVYGDGISAELMLRARF